MKGLYIYLLILMNAPDGSIEHSLEPARSMTHCQIAASAFNGDGEDLGMEAKCIMTGVELPENPPLADIYEQQRLLQQHIATLKEEQAAP